MKILQADDHDLFRDGLGFILAGLDTEQLSLIESQDFETTVEQIKKNTDLDLVLLDLNMPGMSGMSGMGGLRALVSQFPALPIVVLTASSLQADIDLSLQIGAAGFIPKSTPSDVLLDALKLILSGGLYAPRQPEHSRSSDGPPASLTKRQHEILVCIAEGMPNKAIANQLFLSESTIKGHVRAVLQTLNVKNRVQAIKKAREIGQLI